MKIAILLIGHLLFSMIYLYFDMSVKSSRQEWMGLPIENWFSLGYFVPEALFTGSFILIGGDSSKWLETQLRWVEGGFIFLRGIIYALSDSMVYDLNGRQRILSVCIYLFLASVIVVLNARKHGFLQDE